MNETTQVGERQHKIIIWQGILHLYEAQDRQMRDMEVGTGIEQLVYNYVSNEERVYNYPEPFLEFSGYT